MNDRTTWPWVEHSTDGGKTWEPTRVSPLSVVWNKRILRAGGIFSDGFGNHYRMPR